MENLTFFERQDKARLLSARLTVLFILAVAATFLCFHAVGAALAPYVLAFMGVSEDPVPFVVYFRNPLLIVFDCMVASGVVFGGALWKSSEIAAMGVQGVAKSLGGRQVFRGSQVPFERRLYNVVEEMAIASGTSVPRVFIMDAEQGINACAFGSGPEDAGICVTRGALDALTRDELQGVIGHEFSHIVNRDVRLNMRLIGILFGIELISSVSLVVIRSLSGVRVSNGNKKNEGGGIVALIFLAALACMIIGLVGVFFGNIIRAAVSRQREYLADASSVQFTRNPHGIAGALEKIGSPSCGSVISSDKAAQASHLFFGNIFSGQLLEELFQTHPPLVKRIRAIDPSFNGVFPAVVPKNDWSAMLEVDEPAAVGFAGGRASSATPTPRPSAAPTAPAAPAPIRVPAKGAVPVPPVMTDKGPVKASAVFEPQHIFGDRAARTAAGQGSDPAAKLRGARLATSLCEEIPAEASQAVNDYAGARACFYALLTSRDISCSRKQRLALGREESPEIVARYDAVRQLIDPLADSTRLVLMKVALPTLKTSSRQEYDLLRKMTLAFCAADGRLDLFEYAALASAIRELDVFFHVSPAPKQLYAKLRQVETHVAAVLGFIAYGGELRPGDAKAAFEEASRELGARLVMPKKSDCTVNLFTRALNVLAQTRPELMRDILRACYACVAYDGVVTEDEAAALCAVAAALGVPTPDWRAMV